MAAASIHLNTTGSNTSPYDTWAKAATTIATATGGMVAGDYLLVDSAYNTVAAGFTGTFPGTPASPNIIISGTPGATSGLTAYVAGALFASSTTTYSITGSIRAKGITFQSQSASSHDMNICTTSGNVQVLDDCSIFMTGGGGSSTITVGSTTSGAGTYLTIRNSKIKFNGSGQYMTPNYKVDIDGLQLIVSGGVSPTNLFNMASGAHGCELNVQGLDLTNGSAGINILAVPTAAGEFARFHDVRLPASWSGVLCGTLKAGNRVEMWNGDNASTNYRVKILDYSLTVNESTAIYVSSTTVAGQTMSLKCDTTANCSWAAVGKTALFPILVNQSSGTYTVTVELARDSSATPYLNSDIWLELEYLGTTSSTLGVITDNACDLLTFINSGGSNITTSTQTWTGLSGTNNLMKLQFTFTPKKPGYILPKVCFAKPSITCYVDPQATVV